MNDRLLELIEQATIRGGEYLPGNDGHPTPTFYFDKEKFAEIIIMECARIAIESDESWTNQGAASAEAFMKYFGINV